MCVCGGGGMKEHRPSHHLDVGGDEALRWGLHTLHCKKEILPPMLWGLQTLAKRKILRHQYTLLQMMTGQKG
jgi:hypothetical protein